MLTAQTLQRVILPNGKFGAPESMYVNGNSYISKNDEIIVFSDGKISLDTYYNGFSTPLWIEQCNISTVQFKASGKGKAYFKAMLVTEKLAKYELISCEKELNDNLNTILELDISELNDRGIIYIEMSAMGEEFTFSSGEWFTNKKPLRNVKLGISITHYNRKKYVVPSINRIKNEILNDNKYSNLIDFTVVDNSQNITPSEADGVRVIKNKNTGGAGGFMRGMLYYIDKKDFTHVLFMDDDASCEAECIKKTHSILSYSIKDNSAVGGSLFLDNLPNKLIDKGSIFDGFCKPVCGGWHLDNIDKLVKSETDIQFPNFVGWWFFAFPIKYTKYFSFPFFVHGDDIIFSLMNKFHIVTTNGIACYAEDFATKSSAMTHYLDVRCNIVNMFLIKSSTRKIIKIYKTIYLNSLFSHQYATTESIRLAFKHVWSDKNFWKDNLDLKTVRNHINELSKNEKMLSIEIPKSNIDFKNKNESKIRKIIRKASINGILLPMKNKIIYQDKTAHASFKDIFKYKKIFYYNKANGTGYIAEASKPKLIKGLFSLFCDCILMRITIGSQRKKYEELLVELTKESFWRDNLL